MVRDQDPLLLDHLEHDPADQHGPCSTVSGDWRPAIDQQVLDQAVDASDLVHQTVVIVVLASSARWPPAST